MEKIVKGSKKAAARVLRSAAKAIETYGWAQRTYGDQEYGFCALGAMNHVADGYNPARVVASRAIRAVVGTHVVDFNDNVATKKQDVTKAMRKAASLLDHGLKVDQNVLVFQ